MSRLAPTLRLLAAAALIATLGGCVIAGDVRPYPAMAPVEPIMPPSAQATAGAIYAAGPGLQLYSDRRARDVGDLLTITLTENTTAQTTANTSTSKESELSIGTPTIFGAPVTLGGKDILSASAAGSRDFTGKGAKNLRLYRGDELVQVQGIVRAADIFPDNTIPSSRVADARIVYGGRGAIAQSNAMGWLSRFFNSALAPY